jgi:TetR/AcrR family tetracycline transcriptional repressor
MPRTAPRQTTDRPARRGRRRRFSRSEIAEAALELVDSEGLEALSMQRLAQRLGMGTMTLYGYFRDKAELLEAVVDAAVSSAGTPSRTGSWREQMQALVEGAHVTLSRHPALVAIRFRQPILRPDALRFGERIMGILLEAGFGPADASSGFRLIFTYTFGFAGLSPERQAPRSRREAAAAAVALDPSRFPNLSATAPEWARAMAGPEQFRWGLERILDGLEVRLRDPPGSPIASA